MLFHEGGKKDEKKPGSSTVGSEHDATVIALNYCRQATVILTFSNHYTTLKKIIKQIKKTTKTNPIEYYLVFLSSFFPDHAAEVYCGKRTVLYLS